MHHICNEPRKKCFRFSLKFILPTYIIPNVHYTEKFHRNNFYTKNVSDKMLIKESLLFASVPELLIAYFLLNSL